MPDFWLLPQAVRVIQSMQMNLEIKLSELYGSRMKAYDEPANPGPRFVACPLPLVSFLGFSVSPA